jgi:hypothetical protein
MYIRSWGLAATTLAAGVGVVAMATPANAHPHEATPAHHGVGQELANGANHTPYSTTGLTCGGDPAVYGLETAHHGPDAGEAGRRDGCYQLDSMPPGSDDANPAID